MPDHAADYAAMNRASWDERAPAHAASPDYAVARFEADPSFLSGVVSFDRPRLGDVSGLEAVHLQCHIGTDTLSLARLGARMTGLDFSAASLEQARRLAARCGAEIEYVQADVHDAPGALGRERFDLVYTGIGALCWLPSIRRWASVVAQLLRPGGRLFLREGHPMLWTLGVPGRDGKLVVEYSYFERPEAEIFEEPGTYVSTDAVFEHNVTAEWHHGLAETITALTDAGLVLSSFEEHDSVPWEALPGQMQRLENGEYRLADRPWRLAHSYTLQAVKEAGGRGVR